MRNIENIINVMNSQFNGSEIKTYESLGITDSVLNSKFSGSYKAVDIFLQYSVP